MVEARYFGPGFFRFLNELKLHNDRDWFQAHQERYENEVREPFLRLIAALAPRLRKINPDFVVDPRPHGGSMMRIYRDVRFSRDKSPYKTHVAAHFWHVKGKGESAPGYYMHLAPGASLIGGGIWRPPASALKQVRDAIVARPQAWIKAKRSAALAGPCEMGGEALKRAPADYDKDHALIEDIRRKDFVIGYRLSDRDVTAPGFDDLLSRRIKGATPFVQFVTGAVGLTGPAVGRR
jgi:uncharacterized protein (TIGR02453 family)